MKYTNNQVLWDLNYLSFFCSDCKRRVLIGIFPKGFKTPPSDYLVQLDYITDKHVQTLCKYMNARSHNGQWKEYKRERTKRGTYKKRNSLRPRNIYGRFIKSKQQIKMENINK